MGAKRRALRRRRCLRVDVTTYPYRLSRLAHASAPPAPPHLGRSAPLPPGGTFASIISFHAYLFLPRALLSTAFANLNRSGVGLTCVVTHSWLCSTPACIPTSCNTSWAPPSGAAPHTCPCLGGLCGNTFHTATAPLAFRDLVLLYPTIRRTARCARRLPYPTHYTHRINLFGAPHAVLVCRTGHRAYGGRAARRTDGRRVQLLPTTTLPTYMAAFGRYTPYLLLACAYLRSSTPGRHSVALACS